MPLFEGIEFVNARLQHEAHPDTFDIPDDEIYALIEEGVFIKVGCGGERFWVNVGTVDGENYTGLINNDLVFTEEHGLVIGDTITVHKDNILDVYTIDEL